jgi:hypothetical protein
MGFGFDCMDGEFNWLSGCLNDAVYFMSPETKNIFSTVSGNSFYLSLS